MREINFFTPYISTKKPNRSGLLKTIIAFVLMLALCTGFYGWNINKMMNVGAELISTEAFLMNPANLEAVKNFTNTKQKMDILNQYTDGLAIVEKEFAERDIISSVFMKKLNSAIPHAVYLDSLNISDKKVSIEGFGTNRNAVAEYEHNLLKLGLFDEVFVSILSNAAEGSSDIKFTINCVLKGVASNEAK